MQKNILILVIIALIAYFGYSSYQGDGSVSSDTESASSSDGVKAFHPTDDVSAQSQGGKGHTSDGSEVQLP